MTKDNKPYTQEQLQEAANFADILAGIPQKKREAVVTMANVFLSGMEVGERITRASA